MDQNTNTLTTQETDPIKPLTNNIFLSILHLTVFSLASLSLFISIKSFLSVEGESNLQILFFIFISFLVFIRVMSYINKRLVDQGTLVTGGILYSKVFYRTLTIIYLGFPVLLLLATISFTAITLGWGLVGMAYYFESHPIIPAVCGALFWMCLLGYFFAEFLCSFPKCYSGITRYIALFFALSPLLFLICLNPLLGNLRANLQIHEAKQVKKSDDLMLKYEDWKKQKMELQVRKIIPYNQEVSNLVYSLQTSIPSMSLKSSSCFSTSTEQGVTPCTVLWLDFKYDDSLVFNPDIGILKQQLPSENFELIKSTMNQISSLYTKTFTIDEIEFMRSNPLSRRSYPSCGGEGDAVCLGVMIKSEKRSCYRRYLCKESEIENCMLFGANQDPVCK